MLGLRDHVDSEGRLRLELVEVKTLPEEFLPPRDGPIAYEGGRKTAFSLLFRGPADQQLPQDTYALELQELGPLTLFLVPVGQDRKGIYYESVFN